MPTAGFSPPQGNQSTAQLQDWIIKLCRDLEYYMNNLDTVNINRLDARVIIAASITALQIAANSITADKLDVDQLSAITADMGTLTAGIIYGAYIATANGTYPRIEFNSVGNLLTAFADAVNYLSIAPSISGAPSIRFDTPSGTSFISKGAGAMAIISDVGLTLTAPGDINIDSSGGDLRLDSNGHIDINAPSGIRISGTPALVGTKTYYVANSSGGAVTRKLTFTNGILTSET